VPPGRAASIASAALLCGAVVGAVLTVRHLGAGRIADGILAADPARVAVALALMCLAMAGRAASWRAILIAALPGVVVRIGAVLRATSIGVLVSTTVPARAGEPARAMVMTRHLPASGAALPVVLGTIVSQAIINVAALAGLGALALMTSAASLGRPRLPLASFAIGAGIVAIVALAPVALRRAPRTGRGRFLGRAQTLLAQARTGLAVFRSPRRAAEAVGAQVGAWTLQWLSCWALLDAFGLGHRAGAAGAAAVLFAVNVTAAVPVTPSNIGVFQAACVAVLVAAYGVPATQAVAYGVVLQAVEVATAILMGAPALLGEGLVRRRGPSIAVEGGPR
jgi:phosphatidyl-myo-inositol alpha-mannosyltransferase